MIANITYYKVDKANITVLIIITQVKTIIYIIIKWRKNIV